MFWFFFFFQAEDGIRDTSVTGVQTCALPISQPHEDASCSVESLQQDAAPAAAAPAGGRRVEVRRVTRRPAQPQDRSEERRVGKEGRSRGAPTSRNNTKDEE